MRHDAGSRWGWVVLFLSIPGLLPVVAVSQTGMQGGGTELEVTLEMSSGLPGGELTIPIYLTVTDAVDVGSIKFEVLLPAASFSYVGAEPAFSLQEIQGTLEGEWEGNGTGRVMVALQGGGETIPPGLLGYLIFGVDEAAGPRELDLVTENLTVKTVSGEAVLPVKIAGRKVTIMDPESAPIFACFFYMH